MTLRGLWRLLFNQTGPRRQVAEAMDVAQSIARVHLRTELERQKIIRDTVAEAVQRVGESWRRIER